MPFDSEPAVRMASVDDQDQCVELGATFLAYGPYAAVPLDREAFRSFLTALIDKGAVFLSEDGILGGCLNPLYFNPAVVWGAELFWWAPKGGRAMRIAFEDWARAQGAAGVSFSSLHDDRREIAQKLFERAGYRATEVAFVKVF